MTTTTNKGLTLPANGSDVNTWDVPVNGNFTDIDTALGGVTSLNATGASGTVTLTRNQYLPPIIEITGTLTANVIYKVPTGIGGFWSVFNNTTGAFSITFSSGGGGSTVVVPQSYQTALISDGTNIGLFSTAPASAAGSTGQLQYNSTGLLAGSANLTFTSNTLTLKGILSLAGATSGAVGFQVPAAAGSTTYTLPSTPGSAGQFLTEIDGAGTLGWTGATGGVTSFSAGTTGLTPSSSQGGAIILGGTLAITNGGTGATTAAGAMSNLGGLLAANNLSDVASPSTARSNLAVLGIANNLSDVASASTARGNLGLGSAATQNTGTSGANVPLLNGVNTWSGAQTFAGVTASSLTVSGSVSLPSGSVTSSMLATTGVTAGTYGDATHVAQITVNAQGQLTGATSVALAPFSYAQFRNQQTSGTASGESLSSGQWNQRTLNTAVTNNIAGASLSGNQISLPTGTYEVTVQADAGATGNVVSMNHKLRVRNITDGATLVSGLNGGQIIAGGTAPLVVDAFLQGQFTLSGAKTIEVDSWVTQAANGGAAISTGEAEVYVDIYLRKVA